MAKEFVCDMTKGNETSLLIRFSLPMLFGNVFQQFYNMVDSIVVGNYVGSWHDILTDLFLLCTVQWFCYGRRRADVSVFRHEK